MTREPFTFISLLALAVGAGAAIDCSDGGKQPAPTTTPTPFESNPPNVYVAKVKNILVGLPPTDDEVKAVEADPKALGGLVDQWMTMPEYQQKMLTFFELAFQQTQISSGDFVDMFQKAGIGNGPGVPLLVQNVRESFARTALELTNEGRPLNEAMTTKRLMMTPPLMELYAFLDSYHVDDDAKVVDDYSQKNGDPSITLETALGPIPIEETLDESSPNYMHWYSPDAGGLVYKTDPTCSGIDPIVFPASGYIVHWLLYGGIFNHPGPNGNCGSRAGKGGIQFAPEDFTTWKMVTLRPPQSGEATTKFYDLPKLRSSNELVLKTPRPGFFSTPAFFANWSTNSSNQMRVTLNQALIVSTGLSVDGSDPTVPDQTPGLDAAHSSSGAACFTCHQTLDPSRAILSSTYSWFYSPQTDPALAGEKGLFAFHGVVQPVETIDDFANLLATHPAFASGWAEKLCYYVNSGPCLTHDAEFLRVVNAFQASNLSWNVLVKELVSSPLTTNATRTDTTAAAEVVAVVRRDHLCAALDNRLGLVDVCKLEASTNSKPTTVSQIVAGLPSDGYGRGSTIPVLPNQPTLFYRAGIENICEAVSSLVIDAPTDPLAPNAKHWQSASPDSAISDFVGTMMALTPSDPRSAQATALLQAHFAAAIQAGSSASSALKSTFVTACLAPSSLGIGM